MWINSTLLTQTPKQKPGITKQCNEQIRHRAEGTARGSSMISEWTPESSLGLEERYQMTEKYLIAIPEGGQSSEGKDLEKLVSGITIV